MIKHLNFVLSLLMPFAAQAGTVTKNPTLIAEPPPSRYADTLTGNWGGLRDRLADHGILFDLSFTQYYDGLFQGERRNDWEFGGRADAFLHLDTGKLGLWQGGGFHVHGESRFGDAPGQRGGALWPLNTGLVLPLGDEGDIVASSIYLTQKLGDSGMLMLGKINAVDLLASDPFFGGWGRDRFQNIAFVAPPSGVVPPTIIGAVLSYMVDPLSLTFMAFDPDDRTNDYWPDDLFDKGVNLSLGVTWAGKIAGRASSIGVTGTYSTKDGADLGQLLLPAELKTGDKDGAYNVSLGFSHLLYESNSQPGKGFGVYAKGAIADGNPNPIQSSVVAGLAGHGVIPGRPLDSFGIGYFFYNFSDDLQDAVLPLISFDDEQGLEVFYNLAVTPWFRLTTDLQVIAPARSSEETAVYGGLRANITF
jgi:porin